jgi:hypothetical protein
MLKSVFIATFLLAPAGASAITLVTTQTDDAAYENIGGFLQTRYDLPSPTVGSSVLPPLERAVGEVRIGRPNSPAAERTRGFHIATAATGIPVEAGGAGVTQALTNAPSLATIGPGPVGNVTTPWFASYSSDPSVLNSSGPVAFSLERTGTTLIYSVGTASWTDTKAYYSGIDSFSLRLASQTGRTNSIFLNNLDYVDALTPLTGLGSFSAADGTKLIKLFSGISGDFRITGAYTLQVQGALPGASGLSSQFKLLSLGAVPEPGTWAMLIVGFGLVGAAQRRRAVIA